MKDSNKELEMLIRIPLISALALVASAFAQPQGPPPPHGGRGFGPGPFGDARLLGAEPGRPGRVVKNAPYSADIVTESTQALPDGNRIHQTSTSHLYRDSEGRTRREQSLGALGGIAAGAGPQQAIFINDPVSGTNYALNPGNRTATRSTWNPGGHAGPGPGNGNGRQLARRVLPQDGMHVRSLGGSSNVKTEALGRQTIEGLQADGTRTTMTIPTGQIGNEQPIQVVTETWYSPDLQTVVLQKRSDPRSGDTTYRLMNVSRAEPPRTLFEVPADFKITDAPRPRSNQ
jgi:hypothetical protein